MDRGLVEVVGISFFSLVDFIFFEDCWGEQVIRILIDTKPSFFGFVDKVFLKAIPSKDKICQE